MAFCDGDAARGEVDAAYHVAFDAWMSVSHLRFGPSEADDRAFAIAFYPYCGFDLAGDRLAAPLLIQIGAQDDWTPPAPCQRLAAAWQAQDQPVEIDVYPGARHGFDSRAGLSEIATAITIRDFSETCTLRVDADGQTVTQSGGQSVGTPEARVAFLRACGTRGVTFEGNPDARRASQARVDAFIDAHLP